MSNIFDNIGDTKEAASLWGISQDAVKHMCQQGKINARKFGNSWVVDLTQPNPKYNKGDVVGMELTGVKKAVGEFNKWQGAAKIMMDKADGTVWTDIFESSNSWEEYRVNTIITLVGKDSLYGRDDKTSMSSVQQRAEKALKGEEFFTRCDS